MRDFGVDRLLVEVDAAAVAWAYEIEVVEWADEVVAVALVDDIVALRIVELEDIAEVLGRVPCELS